MTRSQVELSGKSLFEWADLPPRGEGSRLTTETDKYNVPVNNKYEALTDKTGTNNPEDLDSTASTISPDEEQNIMLTPAAKPKPIIINNYGEDIRKMTGRAQAVCKKRVTLKYLGNKYSVKTETIEDYQALKDFFTNNEIPHYTYTLAHEKTKIAILKGLPPTYTAKEILDELKTNYDQVTDCKRLTTKNENTNTKYPIYLVKFNGGAQFRDILKMNHILHVRVYWEKYDPRNKVTQCYNCQQYGHGARNCSLKPKCLKCGQDHQSRDCKKPREDPPCCANCSEAHLSNSRNCRNYLNYLNRITKNKGQQAEQRKVGEIQRQLTQNDDSNTSDTTGHNNRTNYWTRPTQTTRPNDENLNDFITLQQVLNEINEIYNLKKFLNKAQTVLTKLKQATKEQDKVAAMFELLADV